MKTWIYWIVLVALLAPASAWAAAGQLTTSFEQRANSDAHFEVQLIRCDNSAAIAGSGPVGGETCESGDWSRVVDARGYTNVSIGFFEYGGGSGAAKLWNCMSVPGGPPAAPSTVGGSVPGTEAPGEAPSAADPDPLCVSLDDAAGVSIVGTAATVQSLNISDQVLHFLVGEIDDCTGECDSTLFLSLGR